MPNRLINETSPYLLQHAHNPVDWYSWSEIAFERAKAEQKPILVSIGYSTCHWCHVMERESFENPHIANFMNQHFINIKVDREERPDVDGVYMEVVQLIAGNGGWPLNCFLLPDGRAFFAGTYFPPRPAHGRASWAQVLNNIHTAFSERRDEVEDQATKILEYLHNSDNYFVNKIETGATTQEFDLEFLHKTFRSLQERFDMQEGGFGNAPKFPATMALRFALQYAHATHSDAALQHVLLSLRKMSLGGIYDQLGGGFARYSVDSEWLVPHFEKMLYDNALLVGLLAEAYQHTQEPLFRQTIEQTLEWVAREMRQPEGGFYSALDADSEGVEGKFYVWQQAEIYALLPAEDAALFCQYYNVSEAGNWEHSNILNCKQTIAEFAQANDLQLDSVSQSLARSRATLLAHRQTRIAPSLDDKSLWDWNALMITAFAQAYKALGNENYKTTALQSADFVLYKLEQKYHSYKNGVAKIDAFLDDFAFWIEALLEVYSVSFEKRFLQLAATATEFVLANFWDETEQLFFFARHSTDLVIRKKDLYDNATPSGNATMVINLQKLAILLDKPDYQATASRMLHALRTSIEKYPQSFGRWATAAFLENQGFKEIAIVGKNYINVAKEIQTHFLPNALIVASEQADEDIALLRGREVVGDDTLIFVCENYTCRLPVRTVADALRLVQEL